MTGSNPAFDRRAATIAIAFMWVSLASMLTGIGLIVLLPGGLAYAACVLLYGALIAAQRRFGIASVLSVVLLSLYAGLLVAWMAGVDSTGYAGAVIFGGLSMTAALLHLSGRPFTVTDASGQGIAELHRVVSLLWIAGYAFALGTTLWLMPSVWFIVVPPAIMVATALAMLFVHFVWCGQRLARCRLVIAGDVVFEQIPPRGPDFEAFCELYARSIVNDPKQMEGTLTLPQVVGTVRDSEIARRREAVIFVCKHQGDVIGSLRALIDRPGRPFPTEADINSSFDALRRHGRLMSIGRLAVRDDFRCRGDIVSGLFNCFVNLALEHDVHYVVSDGFRHVVPMYLRLGFELMYPRSDARHAIRMSHGFVCYPVMMDFKARVLEKAGGADYSTTYAGTINAYLAERWFKRYLMRSATRRLLGHRELPGLEDVREVLLEHRPIVLPSGIT